MKHTTTIAKRLQLVLATIERDDGEQLLHRVSVSSTDVVNPPAELECNIVPLSEDARPIRGASADDGFWGADDQGDDSSAPVLNMISQGWSMEVVKAGDDMLEVMDAAGRVQAAIELDPVLSKLVTYLNFEGSVPVQSTGGTSPFAMVAVVFSMGYSTRRGDPAVAVLNR